MLLLLVAVPESEPRAVCGAAVRECPQPRRSETISRSKHVFSPSESELSSFCIVIKYERTCVISLCLPRGAAKSGALHGEKKFGSCWTSNFFGVAYRNGRLDTVWTKRKRYMLSLQKFSQKTIHTAESSTINFWTRYIRFSGCYISYNILLTKKKNACILKQSWNL